MDPAVVLGKKGAPEATVFAGVGFFTKYASEIWVEWGALVTLKLVHRDQGRAFSSFPRGLTKPFS